MATKEISQEAAEQLNDACAAWLEMAIRELKLSAKKSRLELTGESIASIHGSISKFSTDGVGEIIISFQNSLRVQDWKNQKYSTIAPPDFLTEWVLKIGVDKFKSVPAYNSQSRKNLTQTEAARRIAWGIAVSRFRKGVKKKRRWFAKLFYGPLLARLIQAQIDVLGTSSLRIMDINLDKEY
jgi:hypothetical protein